MISKACRTLCSSCFIFLFISCLSGYGAQTPPTSAMRIQKISNAISKYEAEGNDLKDNDVVNVILNDVAKLYRLEPEAKKNDKTTQEISKIVREKVLLKFPETTETLKNKAAAEAEKIFVMSKILDQVSVNYLKGEKPYVAEGCFFSYGSMGNSINVGGTIISMHDLTPEDRVKFDAGYRNQKKESFIQTKIRDYYSEKNAYSVQVYAEVRDAIIKENEDNGYIFYMNDWRKPSEVVNLLIKEMRTKAVPVKSTPSDPTIPTTPATPEDPNIPIIASKDPAIAKKREEIKKIAEEKLLETTTKNAGIDADQGYELAYWGMKKEDFAILYPQYIAPVASTGTATDTGVETSEIIARESGPLSKLEFYFISGLFYKVVYVFRNPHEAMLAMGNKIKDKYGFTDQEKLDATTAGTAKADTPSAELPLEEIYTWTGKETKGQLTIRRNSEKTAYTDFILSKENPKLKKFGDDLSASIESKKRREAEEQRKKNLEEYNKIK
jgi:hypothetical protein